MTKEIEHPAFAELMAKRKAVFGKKFRPEEIASAEKVAEYTKYLWVSDLCHQWALGRPGYALGRIMQIIGKEGAGKTTKMYRLAHSAFAAGGLAAMVETEQAISLDHMKNCLGPYYNQFNELVNMPDSFESGLTMLIEYLHLFEKIDPKGEIPKVLLYDTIAGSGTERVHKKDFKIGSRGSWGDKANTLKDGIEAMKPLIRRTNTLLVFGNQGKEAMEEGFAGTLPKREVDKIKGQGGRSMDFSATYWAYVKRGANLGSGGEKSGFATTTTFRKNKMRFPDRSFAEHVTYDVPPNAFKPTMDAMAAGKFLGMQSKGGYYWCSELGFGPDEKMRAKEMYEIIHSPETIGRFIEVMDIKMPEGGLDAIHFPTEWGDRRPVVAERGEKEVLDVPQPEAADEEDDD